MVLASIPLASDRTIHSFMGFGWILGNPVTCVYHTLDSEKKNYPVPIENVSNISGVGEQIFN